MLLLCAATVQFIICTFSMWQAVMLSLAACVESDITIYRFTVHASRSAWSLSCNTGYSCVLLTAQVLIVVYVRSDPVWAWSILTIVCFQFLYLVYVYWPRYNRAVPYLGLHSFNNPILGAQPRPRSNESAAAAAAHCCLVAECARPQSIQLAASSFLPISATICHCQQQQK